MKSQLKHFQTCRIHLVLGAIVLLITSVGAAQSWIEDIYEDFADGRLDAAGQNRYVCHDGTVRTIHRFDLNQDGYLDLIFNNTHDTSTNHEATLAAQGSEQVAAGDLNNDGFTDLVFCPNKSGIQNPRRFLTIIWGGKDGWPRYRSHRLLSVRDCKDVAVADINQDGWSDVIALTYPVLDRVEITLDER